MSVPVLTEKLELVLLDGPKLLGTYQYPDALGTYGEMLTLTEHAEVKNFLDWIVANNLSYGHGNLRSRWREWSTASVPFR